MAQNAFCDGFRRGQRILGSPNFRYQRCWAAISATGPMVRGATICPRTPFKPRGIVRRSRRVGNWGAGSVTCRSEPQPVKLSPAAALSPDQDPCLFEDGEVDRKRQLAQCSASTVMARPKCPATRCAQPSRLRRGGPTTQWRADAAHQAPPGRPPTQAGFPTATGSL